jgi:hypothetical protein
VTGETDQGVTLPPPRPCPPPSCPCPPLTLTPLPLTLSPKLASIIVQTKKTNLKPIYSAQVLISK